MSVIEFGKPHPTLISWVEGYLQARGLSTAVVCEQYGFELLAATTIYKRLGWEGIPRHLGGLWLPQIQPNGEPYPRNGQAILWSIHGNTVEKKSIQGANNPTFIGNWRNMADDQMVVVCESIVKAVVVHKVTGNPTVGLNGVDGWSGGHKHPHVDLMNQEIWRGLRTVVLYDSLSTINPDSRKAVKRAKEDCEQVLSAYGGARIFRAKLPDIKANARFPKGQWGVDDFVARRGDKALLELLDKAKEVDVSDTSPATRAVLATNARFGYLYHPSRVVSLGNPRQMWSVSDFDNLYKNVTIRVPGMRGERATVLTQTLAQVWMRHPDRRNIDQLVFQPGEPEFIGQSLNVWKGFAVKPSDGIGQARDWWYKTALRALGKQDGEALVNWMAGLVQRPGFKPGWYIFIHGKPGTGKNFIIEPLKQILGQHMVETSPEGYTNKFNTRFAPARAILFTEMDEELDRNTKPKFEAELKVEADTAPHKRVIEPKGAEKVEVERCASVVMLSNYHPFWPIKKGDRRGFLLDAWEGMRVKDNGGTKTDAYWSERWLWMLQRGGAEQVLAFLLGYKVDWKALERMPPVTAYKRRVIGASSIGNLEATLDEFVANPPEELVGVKHMRAEDLVRLTFGAATELAQDNGTVVRAGRIMGQHPLLEAFRVRVGGLRNPIRVFTIRKSSKNSVVVGQSIKVWVRFWGGS